MLFAVVVSLALSLAAPQRADVNSECPGVERIPFASLTKARLRRAVKEETPLIVTGALETEGMWNVLGKNGGAGFVAAIVKQRMALRFPAYGVDFATRAGAAMTQGRALYHSSIYDALDPVTGKWSAPPSIAVVDSDLIAEDAVESPLGGDDLGALGSGNSRQRKWIVAFGIADSGTGLGVSRTDAWAVLLPRVRRSRASFGKIWYWWPRVTSVPVGIVRKMHLSATAEEVDARMRNFEAERTVPSAMQRCVQRAGEIVWLPRGFAHTTVHIDFPENETKPLLEAERGSAFMIPEGDDRLIVSFGAMAPLTYGGAGRADDLLESVATMFDLAEGGNLPQFENVLDHVLKLQPLLLTNPLMQVVTALKTVFKKEERAREVLDAVLVAASDEKTCEYLRAQVLIKVANVEAHAFRNMKLARTLLLEAAELNTRSGAYAELGAMAGHLSDWKHAAYWGRKHHEVFPFDPSSTDLLEAAEEELAKAAKSEAKAKSAKGGAATTRTAKSEL
jgi:hypothetical protein